MNLSDNHREALKWAGDLLEMVMADVTDEQAHWPPPGTANPIGATYAHALLALDGVIHLLLQGKQPIFSGEWAGKTGISEPNMFSSYEWARALKVDLPQARKYAQAVYSAADAYIASLSGADLDREVDLSNFNLENHSVNWCLNTLAISHVNNMAGEISVLKGLQGGKGYPF